MDARPLRFRIGRPATMLAAVWLVLLQIGLSDQQQDSNFYFGQSQGRFTPSFQNPRNGFFGADTLRANGGNSYQVTNLYLDGDDQQQQQQQQQSRAPPSNGNQYQQVADTTQGYFQPSQYAAFPRPQTNLASSSDYFEISPRPFTVAPPVPSIHSFQFGGSRPAVNRSPAPTLTGLYGQQQQQQQLPASSSLRFPNQPIGASAAGALNGYGPTSAGDSLVREQIRDDTPKPAPYKPPPIYSSRPSRTFPASHEQNLPSGAASVTHHDAPDQFYNTRQSLPFKKPTDYTATPKDQHHPNNPASVRVKSPPANRFQPSSGAAPKQRSTTTTTTTEATTTTAKYSNAPTPRRTRFNPYRSVVSSSSPRPRIKSTTTVATTTAETTTAAPVSHSGSIIRSQSQHYHSRPNLIARQPLFAADESDSLLDNAGNNNSQNNQFRQQSPSVHKQQLQSAAVQKSRLMNVPVALRPWQTATTPSTTTTVTTASVLDQLLNDNHNDDEDEIEYDDDGEDDVQGVRTHDVPLDNETPSSSVAVKPLDKQRQSLRLNGELTDDADYIRSSANQLESSRPPSAAGPSSTTTSTSASSTNSGSSTAPHAVDEEPVILTSNFYLPEGVKNTHVEHVNPDDEYEFEEYDEEEDEEYETDDLTDVPSSSTSSTTARSEVAVVDEVLAEDVVTMVNGVMEPLPVEMTSHAEDTDDVEAVVASDDDDEVLGEAVVSVVTTKSVINGTTTTASANTTSQVELRSPTENVYTDVTSTEDNGTPASADADEELAYTTDEDSTDASTVPIEEDADRAPDTAESSASNSSTENYLVVASVQTSRSVSGARYLPSGVVAQDEKKKVKQDMRASDEDEEEDDDDEEEADDVTGEAADPDDDAIDPTTVPTISLHSQAAEATTEDDTEVIENSSSTDATEADATASIETTVATTAVAQSTESIIDKLDRVQSELSVGLLSGKFPILNEMPAPSGPTTTEDPHIANVPKAPPVVIRRFMPRTTGAPSLQPVRKASAPAPLPIEFDELPQDDLTASLLPAGFQPRNNSYRNKKITTTTTTTTTTTPPPPPPSPTTEAAASEATVDPVRHRSANISRSFKTHPTVQDTAAPQRKYGKQAATRAPFVTVADAVNINQFLPPGYRPPKTTKKPASVSAVAPPPDFKPISDSNLRRPEETTTTTTTTSAPSPKEAARIPVADNIASFLPPGYKASGDDDVSLLDSIPIADDVLSKLLPAGYKPAAKAPTVTAKPKLAPPSVHKFSESDAPVPTEAAAAGANGPDQLLNSVLSKVQFADVSSLLPSGFQPPAATGVETSTVRAMTPAVEKAAGGFKVVFPKGIKRPGSGRITTAAPVHAEGPQAPAITIRKGLRTTTEFTGWPSPSTTPFSIERLLAAQNAESIDISELLGAAAKASSSSTSTTTSTTTTSTTTVRPTQPGLCRSECDLAGTIRIVDGVKWTPELLDHNTAEWKNLAHEVEAQLNEVYNQSASLSRWYKKIRIDSFSEGSVLVDYFVELQDIPKELNTLEIRRMFHEALRPAPKPVVPLRPAKITTASGEQVADADGSNETVTVQSETGEEEEEENLAVAEDDDARSPPNMLLGKFVLDPVSTDFIVIPKQLMPVIEHEEPYSLIPQWAIAVIVIGMASLLFVIVFGVAVLVNRQRRSLKKQPQPLTADMLNELNKNHMGGVDNYGQEDLYNQEDTWSDNKLAIKQKRFANSAHGSSSNIYDSWRSQHRRSSPSTGGTPSDHGGAAHHNYYDANYYPQKAPSYPPPLPPDPYGLMDAHHSTMMVDHRQQHPQPVHHHHQQQQMQHQPLHQHLQYGPPSSSMYGYSGGGGHAQQHHGHHHGPSSRRGYQSRDYDPDF